MADRTFLKLFVPGIRVKRWLVLVLLGAVLIGLSAAFALIAAYRAQPTVLWNYVMWLARAPLWLIALIGVLAGGTAVTIALMGLSRSIMESLSVDSPDLIEAMVETHQLKRGPHIVAIGGGTGLPTLLRGIKAYTANITAIVTVADDGGSSGRLRRDMGVLPPGDFRNNIVALARDEATLAQLFQYRFGEGGLEGHSFGNLFITAMSEVSGGFEEALIETSKVLAVRGKVLPSTLTDVTLTADMRHAGVNGMQRVVGESAIPTAVGVIERVALEPDSPPAYPGAVKAILSADMIVLGPGSLFTSILPNLLVRGIVDALRASNALVVYVCNVATQVGETEGFTVADHVRAIERHTGPGIVDVVLANNKFPPYESRNLTYVAHDEADALSPRCRVVQTPLVNEEKPWRHDSTRLADAIKALLEDKPPA